VYDGGSGTKLTPEIILQITKGIDMKMFISFIITTVYLTITSMIFAEEIKGKENIPSIVREKKITFTHRLSKKLVLS